MFSGLKLNIKISRLLLHSPADLISFGVVRFSFGIHFPVILLPEIKRHDMVSALEGWLLRWPRSRGCAKWPGRHLGDFGGGRMDVETESDRRRLANTATRGKSGRYPVRAGQGR